MARRRPAGAQEPRTAGKAARRGHGRGLAAWARAARLSARSSSGGMGEGTGEPQAGKDPGRGRRAGQFANTSPSLLKTRSGEGDKGNPNLGYTGTQSATRLL